MEQLSKDCQYGTFLDDALRDNFVKGLEDERIQGKLLLEKDLKFSRACEIRKGSKIQQSMRNSSKYGVDAERSQTIQPGSQNTQDDGTKG
ncbi:hypothetical protein QE152_g13645 [Popillia japonica]|uniref:Uncharacterized protein n=1 Tax=Popillia japonica TaxID=7064 RepID=A0AAW1LC29_POPJA